MRLHAKQSLNANYFELNFCGIYRQKTTNQPQPAIRSLLTDRLLPITSSKSRNFGVSAAHSAYPVPLLPSGPGGVRGTSLHEARSSTIRHSLESRVPFQFNTHISSSKCVYLTPPSTAPPRSPCARLLCPSLQNSLRTHPAPAPSCRETQSLSRAPVSLACRSFCLPQPC